MQGYNFVQQYDNFFLTPGRFPGEKLSVTSSSFNIIPSIFPCNYSEDNLIKLLLNQGAFCLASTMFVVVAR